MTSEHRLLFTLKDIRAVRWECNACHTAISLKLDQSYQLPELCPSCQAQMLNLEGLDDHRVIRKFFEALKSATDVIDGTEARPAKATLQLEFDQPRHEGLAVSPKNQ